MGSVIGDPIFTQAVPAGTAAGTYGPISVPVDFSTVPDGATDLLLVADPDNLLGSGPTVESIELVNLSPLEISGSFSDHSVSGDFKRRARF